LSVCLNIPDELQVSSVQLVVQHDALIVLHDVQVIVVFLHPLR
jgi:hypothetical protein